MTIQTIRTPEGVWEINSLDCALHLIDLHGESYCTLDGVTELLDKIGWPPVRGGVVGRLGNEVLSAPDIMMTGPLRLSLWSRSSILAWRKSLMPQPLTDPVALLLLDAFMRAPHKPEHLGMLRDRLFDLERQDLLEALASYTPAWQNDIIVLKRADRRREFAKFLKSFRACVDLKLAGAYSGARSEYSSVKAVQGTGQPG